MIGSDHPLFHLALREVPGSQPSDPIARLTNLGWVCFDPTLVDAFGQETRMHFTRTCRTNQNEAIQPQAPGDILRQFWELESLGIKEHTDQPMTIDDKAAIKLVSQALEFKDGRYEVAMPWKDGEPKLDNNFEAAMHRLKSQERSLKRNGPQLMKAYNRIFTEYEKKGYIKSVPKTEASDQWFLPHFPVIRPDKDTTKTRATFDAAMKYNGKSLKDTLRSGPKLQREITDVLTRFRRAPVALGSDISEMFLQVGIREEDRKYHRFLW